MALLCTEYYREKTSHDHSCYSKYTIAFFPYDHYVKLTYRSEFCFWKAPKYLCKRSNTVATINFISLLFHSGVDYSPGNSTNKTIFNSFIHLSGRRSSISVQATQDPSSRFIAFASSSEQSLALSGLQLDSESKYS